MRAALIALVGAVGASALSAQPVPNDAPYPEAKPGCRTPSGWGCSVDNLRAASEATLRAAGPVISVSCDPRLEESSVDAAYMQGCVEDIRGLSAFLSEKWATVLHPIEPGTIRYVWDREFGCLDFVFGNDQGGGICPVYGEARIPLSWRYTDSAISSVE